MRSYRQLWHVNSNSLCILLLPCPSCLPGWTVCCLLRSSTLCCICSPPRAHFILSALHSTPRSTAHNATEVHWLHSRCSKKPRHRILHSTPSTARPLKRSINSTTTTTSSTIKHESSHASHPPTHSTSSPSSPSPSSLLSLSAILRPTQTPSCTLHPLRLQSPQ